MPRCAKFPNAEPRPPTLQKSGGSFCPFSPCLNRQGASDIRQGIADIRQGAANICQALADIRQDITDIREAPGDLRNAHADIPKGAG